MRLVDMLVFGLSSIVDVYERINAAYDNSLIFGLAC